MTHEVDIKRAYDAPSPHDGFRVYIDRLWPRGLSHATFHYDLWDKEIAPSTALREWFHTSPDAHWEEFVRRYRTELDAGEAFASLLKAVADKPRVTLLYSSHDRTQNNALVVEQMLIEKGWTQITPQ